MVEGKDATNKRGENKTKRLGILFGALCFLIVGLTAAIVVVVVNKNNKGEEEEKEPEIATTCADNWQITDVVDCVRKSYVYKAENLKIGENGCTGICYEYYKTAMEYINTHDSAENADNIRMIFNDFILAVNDDASAVGLKLMRNLELSKFDYSDEFTNEMLKDAIEADEFLKSPSSADTVLVYAYKLNREDLIQQYTAIKTERELEMGIDSSKGLGEG